MKKLLSAFAGFALLAAPADAQVKTYGGGKYWTGHVTAKGIVSIHEAARKRLGNHVATLPKATEAKFDCRDQGWVPPIRDQSQCGSCWDFSGSGVVTSALIKAKQIPNGPNGCSEQYTLDCGQNGGCNGDDNITVLQWAKATGLPLDDAYGGYHASSRKCGYSSSMKLYKITDWGFCTPNQQQGVAAVQDIKNAMKAYGPIGTGIDAGVLGDGTGIIGGSGHSIDHDVIIVGWDDGLGGGCWVMRNSWGTGWGQGGYCTIKYGSGDIGTEACWAVAQSVAPVNPWVFSTGALELPREELVVVACCGNQVEAKPQPVLSHEDGDKKPEKPEKPGLFPLGYAIAYERALLEDRPLIVYVGTERLYLSGAIELTATSFPDAKGPTVVVGAPVNGELKCVYMPGTQTADAVKASIFKLRFGWVTAAKTAGGCGCTVCPLGGTCNQFQSCGSPYCPFTYPRSAQQVQPQPAFQYQPPQPFFAPPPMMGGFGGGFGGMRFGGGGCGPSGCR